MILEDVDFMSTGGSQMAHDATNYVVEGVRWILIFLTSRINLVNQCARVRISMSWSGGTTGPLRFRWSRQASHCLTQYWVSCIVLLGTAILRASTTCSLVIGVAKHELLPVECCEIAEAAFWVAILWGVGCCWVGLLESTCCSRVGLWDSSC